MDKNIRIVKYACYTTNVCMSIVGNLSPILFLTFHSMYGISYSLLGLLILINFVSQLTIDLIFSFFSQKFNIEKVVKCTPLITAAGLAVYALFPYIFPDFVYLGIVIGTIIFSVSSGLAEVLISPVIAALPAENPDKEMSKLHSVYAWGVVFVIAFSTVFLLLFGRENWQLLALALIAVPLVSAALFSKARLPKMETPEKTGDVFRWLKNKYLWLSVFAIFLGGASECTMAQWSSSYIEKVFGMDKVYGDIFGVALFSVMLGLGRTMYSKIGRNIERVLIAGAVGAAVCYLIAAVTDIQILGLIACAATGFFVSMLWPGNLIVISKRFPAGGVFMFAMMAAGGDLGASVVPQLVGVVADRVIGSSRMLELARQLSLTPDQLGLKIGMLTALIFPAAAIFVYTVIIRTRNKKTYMK